jgi:hypothetical protein
LHVISATFSPDGSRIVTASWDKSARIWDAHLQTMSTKLLLREACARLSGLAKVTRDEMRLAGYPDSTPEIDVCERRKQRQSARQPASILVYCRKTSDDQNLKSRAACS